MNNILEYRGYCTKIQYSKEDCILYGKIEGINDLIIFECQSAKDIEKEFQEAVDDYLEFCESMGKSPEKAYKGVFNVRVSPELHQKIARAAFVEDVTLNKYVEDSLKYYHDKYRGTHEELKKDIVELSEIVSSHQKILNEKMNKDNWNPVVMVLPNNQKYAIK